MIVHVVIDLVYGEEGSPGVRLFKTEKSAIAEEDRLIAEDPQDGTYLVIRTTQELEE